MEILQSCSAKLEMYLCKWLFSLGHWDAMATGWAKCWHISFQQHCSGLSGKVIYWFAEGLPSSSSYLPWAQPPLGGNFFWRDFIFLVPIDGGRKSEYPEGNPREHVRTCKLHTERPSTRTEPRTFVLRQCEPLHQHATQGCIHTLEYAINHLNWITWRCYYKRNAILNFRKIKWAAESSNANSNISLGAR